LFELILAFDLGNLQMNQPEGRVGLRATARRWGQYHRAVAGGLTIEQQNARNII